jgi:hypothetical protein
MQYVIVEFVGSLPPGNDQPLPHVAGIPDRTVVKENLERLEGPDRCFKSFFQFTVAWTRQSPRLRHALRLEGARGRLDASRLPLCSSMAAEAVTCIEQSHKGHRSCGHFRR